MNLNKYLPKYKKTWEKEHAITPLFRNEDNGIYLIIENYDALNHGGIVKREIISQTRLSTEFDKTYIFEVFKYMKKFQAMPTKKVMSTNTLYLNPYQIKKEVVKHLITKRSKQNIFYKNLVHIKAYNDFVEYCFNLLRVNTSISLVIQKKIGYKYYQNTIYK